MRLFVAIYPPRPAVDDLTAEVARLRVGVASAGGTNVRLADPAHAHLTLAFLGDVEECRLVDVESTLGLAAETFRNGRDSAPLLRLGGGGSFGRGRFTVLWVDVRGDVDALATLARLIRFGLRRAKLPHDDKPFRAHLTIARPGDRIDRADILADREALHDYTGPEWPAEKLTLVRSHPGPHPTYDHLATWPL
ncbi:RNA 2',3'-cyclic phosphodiesterase [Micromonospora soli]|uniref:RNA 2',3'-cyclic phosphodiesterase n=1 Tax=Micromonospora sp. NBRC 110009 TaxID=3061627 RepID=UPI0026726757|nr:RNA 2',3'-cyclic phosphodiesterase [Micromonospora sp. NBRC 110009]WKU00545.1 RNA 2',3'-cyclic phosphodiesterase [Micromonospora sp. NBRC 110009]